MPKTLPYEEKVLRHDLDHFSYDEASLNKLEVRLGDLYETLKSTISRVAVFKQLLPKLEPRVEEIRKMIEDTEDALKQRMMEGDIHH